MQKTNKGTMVPNTLHLFMAGGGLSTVTNLIGRQSSPHLRNRTDLSPSLPSAEQSHCIGASVNVPGPPAVGIDAQRRRVELRHEVVQRDAGGLQPLR